MKKTKTPQQIINEAREEFEKKMFEETASNDEPVIKISTGNGPFAYRHANKSDILSWHTTTLKAFIEAEIERLESKKEKLPHIPRLCQNQNGLDYCGTCEQAWEDCSCPARNTGFKKAIDDQIIHLKQIKL